MASDGVYSVSLDEAIAAMRITAADMSVKYKETSLSVSSCIQCSYKLSLLRRANAVGTCGMYCHFSLEILFQYSFVLYCRQL